MKAKSAFRSFIAASTLLGCVAVLMPIPAGAQSPVCVSGRFIAQTPSGNGQVQFCLPSLRDDPTIVALQDGMNRILRQSNDQSARVQRLTRVLESMSTQLSDRQLDALAKNLAKQLDPLLLNGDSRLARAIERLSLNAEEFQDKVKDASGPGEKTERVRAALAGEGGDAVARLDFDTAGRIVDDLKNIRAGVDSANQKLDQVGADIRLIRDGNALDQAFQLLRDVAKAKPKGDIGQAAALQLLSNAGRSFSGLDLSGLPFRSVQADRLDLAGANLQLAGFPGSRLREANFRNADITAVDFTGSDLSRTDLTMALAPFVRAPGASFEGANLGRSSWVAADLRNANFRSADLRAANLGLADLRGADFRGAKLQNAFLGGADLRDARFEGAEFSNTDIVAAVVQTSVLSAAQNKGVCSAGNQSNGWRLRFVAMEALVKPISLNLEDILAYKNAAVFWPDTALALFPLCASAASNSLPRGLLKGEGNDLREEFRIDVSGALMEAGNRRADLVSLITERTSSVTARISTAMAIPQARAAATTQSKVLEARLAELTARAKPSAPPEMGETDTQLVLLQRLASPTLDSLVGGRNYLGREDASAWPQLFAGANMGYFSNWNADTTRLWRSWVSTRAKAWIDGEVVFRKQSPCVRPLADPRYASGNSEAVAAVAAAPVSRLAWGPRLEMGGLNPEGTGWQEDIQGIFVFDSAPTDVGKECGLRVVGARLVQVPASGGSRATRYVVWSVKALQPQHATAEAKPEPSKQRDVVGIRLGMSETDADRAVRSRMGVAWLYRRAQVDGMGDRPHQTMRLYISKDQRENIAVYVAPSRQGFAVVAVRRTEAAEGPVPDDTIQDLLTKRYGRPDIHQDKSHRWVWGSGQCGTSESSEFRLAELRLVEGGAVTAEEFRKVVKVRDILNRSPSFTPEIFLRTGRVKCSPYLLVSTQSKLTETTLLDYSLTPWNPPVPAAKDIPHF